MGFFEEILKFWMDITTPISETANSEGTLYQSFNIKYIVLHARRETGSAASSRKLSLIDVECTAKKIGKKKRYEWIGYQKRLNNC